MLKEHGPERPGGQGLDPHQYESGDRTIVALLTEPPARDQVDLVATWRDGAYEVWARRGMVRFKRFIDDAGNLSFEVIEQIGENPVANQDPFAVSTIEEEMRAAAASGNPSEDPNVVFFEPHALSHPFAYERIAQVFDSPRGPDLVVSPKAYAYGVQPGQHGALDVVQSRAPLIFSGPGVRPGRHRVAARHVDIAPTIAHLMGFPVIDGHGPAGARHQRGVYMRRQDGRALHELVDGNGARPARVYTILLDGLSHSELVYHLVNNPGAIPNLARLANAGATLSHGSTVNFPSITWPSHSTIVTGAWSGHHDIVNPTFHDREKRQTVPVQGLIFETEHYLNGEVETLYEAFKRVYGPDALTVSIHEPQGRGADHHVFEHRIVGDKARLKEITISLIDDISPRWLADQKPAMQREEIVDIRGMAQLINLFEHCGENAPVFVAHEFVLTDGAGHDYGPHHEGLREALARTDARIGKVLALLHRHGVLDSTLFVVTSDHGMAPQRIELAANPTAEPAKAGIKGVFAEPMIYLRDLAIECVRANDRRTLRVTVCDNDPDESGERPPVEGATVMLLDRGGRVLGRGTTSLLGIAAFATAANLPDTDLVVEVEHAEFNRRRLRASGEPIPYNVRGTLYGEAAR
jgi:phosphonoacetate hydrolase